MSKIFHLIVPSCWIFAFDKTMTRLFSTSRAVYFCGVKENEWKLLSCGSCIYHTGFIFFIWVSSLLRECRLSECISRETINVWIRSNSHHSVDRKFQSVSYRGYKYGMAFRRPLVCHLVKTRWKMLSVNHRLWNGTITNVHIA